MAPQKTQWTLVILIWLAGLGAAAQYGKMAIMFDLLARAYPEAGAGIGWAVSLVGLAGVFLGVVAGLLVASIGYRRALLGALWIGAAFSAVQALLPPLPVMLGLRALEGLSHLAIVVAAPTMIAEVTAIRGRGFALTLWGSFFGVSFAILAVLGLPLATSFGPAALLLAHAVWMAAAALLLSPRLPRVEAAVVSAPISASSVLRDHWAIYASPRIGAAGVGWLFYTLCFVSILTLLPFVLAPDMRAFVIGAMPILSIVASLTIGVWLLRWLAATSVVIAGFALSAALALALAFDAGDVALCLALSCGLGLVQGASFAAVAELNEAPSARAAGYGAMAQTGNIGNLLGTPLLAAILGAGGNSAMMTAAAVMLALGGVAHVGLAVLRRRL